MVLSLMVMGVAWPLSQVLAQETAEPVAVDWSLFIVDRDGDRLDDSLEAIAGTPHNRDNLYDITMRLDHFPTPTELEQLASWGIHVGYVSKAINAPIMEGVPAHRLDDLARFPGVIYVEPTQVLKWTMEYGAPALKARDSTNYSPNTAWDMGYMGDGINIAIMDSGVNNVFVGVGHTGLDDMDDDLLTQDPKLISGVDCMSGVCIPQDPEMGDSAHGTHVAGIATGTGSSGETSANRGVAPNARLIDIRVGAATNLNIMGVYAGYDWVIANVDTDWEMDGDANNGVHILSQSFGGAGSNGQDALSLAMNEVAEAGIVCVVAAGNSGPGASTLGSPAVADHAITIANINDKDTINRNDDSIASSSSRGPRASDGDTDPYDEMKPDVGAPGTNVMAPLAWSKVMYGAMSGTSMAAPAVAGVIALILEANPEMQPTAAIDYEQPLKQILRDTAQDYGSATYPLLSAKYDTAYGWGQADAWASIMRSLNLKTTSMSNGGLTYSGSKATVTGTFDFTRTPHTEEDDELVYSFLLPTGWSQPSGSDVSVDSSYSTSHTTRTTNSGGRWTMEVTVQVKNPPGSPRTEPVAVTMKATAPTVTSTRSFQFELDLEMTDITADPATTSVTVSPGEQADLMVELMPVTPTVPQEGEEVEVQVRVTNQGDSAASADLELTDGTSTLLDQSISVPAVGQRTYIYDWDTTSDVGNTEFTASLSNIDPPDNDVSNDEDDLTVRVNGQPTAIIDSNVTQADSGEPILFDGQDSTDERQVEEYRFDLGDGNQTNWGTSDEYEHSYTDAGEYEASVQVRDDDGWESEWSEPVTILINGAPIARLTADASVVRPFENIEYNASGSSDTEGDVVNYRFDLGDGNVTDWQGNNAFYDYHYDEPGWYPARVQVRDEEGQTSKWSQPYVLKVNDRPLASLHVTDNSLNKLNVTIVGLNQTVELNGTLSTDDDKFLEAYRFDLGDGTDYTPWQAEATYLYNYSQPQTYDLKVQVRDGDGWESEWSSEWDLTVNQQPFAKLEANTTMTRSGWEVAFDASDSYDEGGAIEEYRFDFGDGELSDWQTQTTITHIYQETGDFVALAQVKDDSGTPSDWSDPISISVNGRPTAIITADSDEIKQEASVTFDGGSSLDDGSIAAYRFWLAGEDPMDWQEASSLELSFPEPGTYYMLVQVEDDLGWQSAWSQPFELTVTAFHRELSLEGTQEPIFVSPGKKSYVDLTLTNQGEVNETVTVEVVQGMGGWSVKLDQEEFELEPAQAVTIQVQVRPPGSAQDLDYQLLGLAAIPEETIQGPDVVWSGIFVVLDPIYDQWATLQDGQLAVPVDDIRTTELTLVNIGNRPQELALEATPPVGWQVTFESDTVALDPMEWTNITVMVQGPEVAELGSTLMELTIQGNETQNRLFLALTSFEPKLTLGAGQHALNVPKGEAVILQYQAPEMTENELILGLEGGELTALSLVNKLHNKADVDGLGETLLLSNELEVAGVYFELENQEAQSYTLVLDNREGEYDLEAQLTILELPLKTRPTGDGDDDSPGPSFLLALGSGALALIVVNRRRR